ARRDLRSFPTRRSSDLVGLLRAGEQAQQRRLAVAVAADDADAVALVDADGDVVEQHAIGQRDVEGLGAEQMSHAGGVLLGTGSRSEEHTSELQSRENLV